MSEIAGIRDRRLTASAEELATLNQSVFPVLDEEVAANMRRAIEVAAKEGDSVGGILETLVLGMPAGVGEPWFDTVEGVLAHALFGVPAVKGVEFGAGFGMATMRGSQANDAFCVENGMVKTMTNQNGGVNGGITNGMPILFRCAVKPTPSIFKKQGSVELASMKEATLVLQGRHDPCIVHRARVVVDSVTALVLSDLLAQRFGTDYFRG